MLAQEAVSEAAQNDCLVLLPSVNRDEVIMRLEETTAAVSMMTIRGTPSFSGIRDVRPALDRAALGGVLNTRELTDIASLLRTARLVKGYTAEKDAVGKTSIDYLFAGLRANKFLEEKIMTSIIGDDEISDSASADLADIRRKMRAASARAREALQKIISSPSYAKALQENIITTRSDRYVVPVKAEFKSAIPGLVHDISATGATLFVEPMAAVKANNELRELAAKEKLEIERILAELSADCAEHRADIESDFALLTRLDVIFAKAKLSYKLECAVPEIEAGKERCVVLRHARHPLLNKDSVVPIDIELGNGFDTLIITGPNTGGKTVSLKTLGLLALMNQCGLHIPTDSGSVLPVFSSVLADIGDEQSIEQNLSTFSAHMANIIAILGQCDEDSLVLFDELGAGTDPSEGAALAVSIIEKVRSKGAMIAATTHYTELKVYASNSEGVLNASCEFDVETLKPTYKLLLGIPGKSNAFAISSRLGLDEEIINDAKSRISSDNAQFEKTIEKLEATRLKLERDREEERMLLHEAQENAKKAARLKAELEVRLEKADVKSKREAESIIAEARRAAEDVYRELDEMRSRIYEDEEASAINEARNALRRRLNEADEKLNPHIENIKDDRVSSRKIQVGDIVEIRSMGVKAEVTGVSGSTLTLKAGIMTVSADEEDVYLLDGVKEISKKATNARRGQAKGMTASTLRTASVPREIDIRGMETIEGVAAAERYIDSAVMAKISPVTIIHGKGTGALRAAIHAMLKKNKLVKSYRLGLFGEGESGVTVVELKIK